MHRTRVSMIGLQSTSLTIRTHTAIAYTHLRFGGAKDTLRVVYVSGKVRKRGFRVRSFDRQKLNCNRGLRSRLGLKLGYN